MARPRAQLDDKHRQADRVGELLANKSLEGWKRLRLTAVSLGLRGDLTLAAIAETVGASYGSVCDWFARYRAGGVDALLTKAKSPGRPTKFDANVRESLSKELTQNLHRRAADVAQWLEKTHGVTTKGGSIYRYLSAVKAALKVPRPSHQKKTRPKAAPSVRSSGKR